jgi:di/tricarboxylate transporter
MNPSLLYVSALLGACVVCFVLNKPRMDAVALLALVVLPLTGVMTVSEALAGFGDPTILLIAVLFVVGEGLLRTGVAYRLSDALTRHAGKSQTRLLVLLMLAVALLGSVMSSTGVVAIFIPVALGVARKMRISPGQLMMPLSFAGLISGMLTLVGTAPNLVVDSALKKEGLEGLGFFAITPVGLVVLALGVVYMVWMRRHLASAPPSRNGPENQGFGALIERYHLASREHRLRVSPGSPLAGGVLGQLDLRGAHDFTVVAIEREARFGLEMVNPDATTRLHAGDVLLVDMLSENTDTRAVFEALKLEPLPLTGAYFSDRSRRIGMAEVLVPPDSALAGRTVREAAFRTRHSLHVIGMRRASGAIREFVADEKMRPADTLLVIGPWKAIRQLQRDARDFLVPGLPVESAEDTPAADRAPFALLSLGIMIVLMVTGVVPNAVAALGAALLMGAFRCVDLPSAYRAIHWPSLVLIAGMMPFSLALERTGGVALVADNLIGVLHGASPRVVLACVFLITAVIGLFISNTVTAVLMAPIALHLARQLGVSPTPFALTVALGASTAFVTPVSSPVNMLVVEPGNYRFGDFVRIGGPFAVVVLVVTVLLVPVLFPF